MFGAKFFRRLYTRIRKRILARKRARLRRASDHVEDSLIRLKLREHTHPRGGRFGQPVTNYYCKIYVGSPKKRFNIQFDLALNDHFIPHKEKLRLSQHFKRGYRSKGSITSEKLDSTCKLAHLGCHLSGKSYIDDVRLELYPANKMRTRSMICKTSSKSIKQSDSDSAGDSDSNDSSDECKDNMHRNTIDGYGISSGFRNLDAHNLIALRMQFIGISRDKNNQYYSKTGIDGFFGLGLCHESKNGCKNLLDLLKETGQINQSIFSLNFNRAECKNRFMAPPLELCLGGFERTQFYEPIYWHKSNSKKHWIIKLTSVYLGDDFIGYFKSPRHLALLTTSENEIFAPIELVQKIYNLIGAKQNESNGLHYVDCRSVSKLPSLKISTKKMTITLEPDDYIRQIDGKCFVAIMPSGKRNQVQWRLGTCFLSKPYAIFNLSNRRIGFANLTNSEAIQAVY